MNRRSFVQTVGVGAVGALTALKTDLGAQAPAAAQARPAGGALAGAIRIGSNENPYGPSPLALAAISKVAGGANRYPGPLVGELISTVAAKHGVPEEMVLLSGGSGDILTAVVKAYTSKARGMVTGLPSYESPVRTAERAGAPVIAVPLTPDLRLDLKAMTAKAAGAGLVFLVYICNPNNPTSTVVPAADVTALIEAVIKASPTTRILVDEAYFEYADMPGFDTATPLTKKYPQVIMARTMSKIHGMAGMRVGYAIAQAKTLTEIREFHSGSGLSSMSLAAATASLKDTANLEKNRTMNREVRKFTTDAFVKAGYTVAASDANFIFVNIKRDSRGFQEACRQKGVMVGRAFPPMTTWARISVGTQEEMDKAVPVFLTVLGAAPVQTASFDHLDALPNELT